MTILRFSITENGINLTSLQPSDPLEDNNALATIAIKTDYQFDNNVIAKLHIIDNKQKVTATDPLQNYSFRIELRDKIDDSLITYLQGSLYTGGGIDKLAEDYPKDFGYIRSKLDFYGALDGDDDFIDEVITSYQVGNVEKLKEVLTDNLKIVNTLNAFRIKSTTLAVPANKKQYITLDGIKRSLLDMTDRPRYLTTCDINDLTIVETLAEVIARLNSHLIIDIGEMTDWRMVVALANSLDFKDHRIFLLWSPNKSRPMNATTVLARKKWRPVNGDFLGQVLLRNANTNDSGIVPVHENLGGFDTPVGQRDLKRMDGVILDEEAQDALAQAKINVVLSEHFTEGQRWIYNDVLTQYDSKTSILRLFNASEVATYIENNAVSIAKRHLLKRTDKYIEDTESDIKKMLNACVGAELIQISEELQSYYSLAVSPRRDNPYEKVDIKLAFRPMGCTRQVFIETTIVK